MSYEAKIAAYKKTEVQELIKLMQEYPVIGLVNVENLPARQLQILRAKLRQDVLIRMSKKPLIQRSIVEVKKSKKDFDKLGEHIVGMPALLFTTRNPFKVSALIKASKSKAPAKSGQIAPYDLTIPAGPTSFTPGPIISELASVGIKTGVEGGKLTVKEAATIVKKGQTVTQKTAEVLAKFSIEPMEIGLDLVAAYEDGLVYNKDVLSIDPAHYIGMLGTAAAESLALSVEIAFPTKDNISRLIGRAYNVSKNLALQQNILSDVLIEKQVGETVRAAKFIAKSAHIEVVETRAEPAPAEPAQPAPKEQPAPKAANKLSEDFKDEIAAEKQRRDSVSHAQAEELAEQLKKKGTLR